MAAILKKIWEGYKFLFETICDQRTKPWFLVSKPYQVLAILGLYLTFVLKWGPKFMKGKPAYNLDKLLIVYNFLQVIACIYLFYNSLILAWGWNYKWICEPVDFSTSEHAIAIARLTYYYFIMKVVDLIDTVFFVLRKKFNQITFLHIYHHTGMVLLIWGAVTYLPGGHATLIGVINTFVHIVMYSYYLYTVVNPSAKQSLWWKKYITQLQILQFFWCVVHMLTIVFVTDCAYPRWTSAVFLPQNCFILVLFVDFYIKNYIRKPKTKQTADLQNKTILNNGHGLLNGQYTSSSNTAVEKMNTEEFKNKGQELQKGISPQNETKSAQIETSSLSSHRSQNRSKSSQNVLQNPVNRSIVSDHCYHNNKDGKHEKSE